MHIALISENGTVWDISLDENKSPSEGYLFKLQDNSCTYHGYSDAKGVLYIIDGFLVAKVVKYHSSFNENGHKKGSKLDINKLPCYGTTCINGYEDMCFTQSLLFGNFFWFFGATYFQEIWMNGGRYFHKVDIFVNFPPYFEQHNY